MDRVNLIPAARLARQQRKTRLHLWGVVCGAYLVVLAGGSLLLRVSGATEDRSAAAQWAAATRAVEQNNQTMQELRRELAEATTAWETAKAIRAQPDWSKLFLGLAEQMGEETVISRCQLLTLTQDGRMVTETWSDSAPAAPLTVFLAECRHKLVLNGFGKTQEAVSRFVLRLEGAGTFDTVRLVNSSRQTFLNGEAVAFNVECLF